MAMHNFKRSQENIIDPSLERTDPTPCIYTLFRQFNKTFFWDSLNMVAVSWSSRMTSCAGVCSFHPRSRECHVRLSAPLLSLRPRKDLVETLLHEMIHAYLFMTNNNRDREDHGPEFHKHMYRINAAAGTNISVYHTFRDEVKHYQNHVWRCDGPCQKRPPFFGIVRRSTNRAPGHYDRWWERHRTECSGTFQKIEEPPGYKSKGKKPAIMKENKNTTFGSDMRNYFPSTSGGKINSIQNVKPDQKNSNPQSNFPKISANIHTFGSGVTGQANNNSTPRHNTAGNGSKTWGAPAGGVKVNGRSSSTVVVTGKPGARTTTAPAARQTTPAPFGLPASATPTTSSAREHVRNVWANKFSDNTCSSSGSNFKRPVDRPKSDAPNAKKPKSDNVVVECENYELMVAQEKMSQHLRECKGGNSSRPAEMSSSSDRPCPVCNMPVQNGSLEAHLSVCLEDSITDDFFSQEEESLDKPTSDLNNYVTCPICLKTVVAGNVNAHIDDCLTLQALKNGSL